MKKKVGKILLLIGFIIIIIAEIYNIYLWTMCGKQFITISIAEQPRTVSIKAHKNGVYLQTNVKVKLVDSNGNKFENVRVTYDENSSSITIPQVKPGKYFIEARISSKAGVDKIKTTIDISYGDNIKIYETTMRNTEKEREACGISVVLYLIIFVIIEGYLFIKIPEFGNIVKHVANVIVIIAAVIIEINIIQEGHYFVHYDYSMWMIILTAVICLLYSLYLIYKLNNKKYVTSISIILFIILGFAIEILNRITEIYSVHYLLLTFVIISGIIMLIVDRILRRIDTKKLKHFELVEKVSNAIIYVYKFVIVVIFSYVVSTIITATSTLIFNNSISIFFYVVSISIFMLVMYWLNGFWNKSYVKEDNQKRLIVSDVISVLAGILTLFILI